MQETSNEAVSCQSRRRVADVTAEPIFEMVERALGHRDSQPIPILPADPGAPVPYQPGIRGMAGTYAATSLPARNDPRP